jgi:hypothetical protein
VHLMMLATGTCRGFDGKNANSLISNSIVRWLKYNIRGFNL